MSLFAGVVGCPTIKMVGVHLEKFAATLDGVGAASPRYWRSNSVALVHRQRIYTAEDRSERQPLAGARSVLMFDGRLDNRDDLTEALGIGGAGIPDSALVLAALERWGEESVARLVGPFALAWWDDEDRRLLLARDSLGQRALYHADTPDGFAFATTPRALLALPEVQRRIDEAAMAAFLVDLPLPPGSTYYKHIRQIPAAHVAVWQPNKFELRRYWQPDYSKKLQYRCDDDYVEAAREHLTRAVRSCLRTDRPIASTLSGGLDSTLVATTAARLMAPTRLMALTAIPAEGLSLPKFGKNQFVDEGRYARSTADLHDNIDLHLVVGTGVQRIETEPERMFLSTGWPVRNTLNIGWFTPMRELAEAQGIGVLLQGSGGNHTLSWDGIVGLRDAARSGRLVRLWREISHLARSRDLSFAQTMWSLALRPLLPIATPQWFDQLRRRPAPPLMNTFSIHPNFATAHQVGIDKRNHVMRAKFGGEETARREALELYQSHAQVRSGLRAIYGFDLREPLRDLRLLEFCFAVPSDQYLRNGVTRWLARRVLAGQAPPEVVSNPQRGVQCPEFLNRLLPRRAEFLATIEELERSPMARNCLDLPRLKSLAHSLPTEPAAAHYIPYAAVLERGLHAGRFIRWVEGGNG